MNTENKITNVESNLLDVFCELKWFNTAKGYGFVRANGLTADIFIHSSTLQSDNHPLVGEGASLKCNIAKSNNGYFVEKVLNVIDCGNTPFTKSQNEDEQGQIITTRGIVKWYKPDQEFGFILPDDGVKDIFVHATCLKNSGLDELVAGQIVEVSYKAVLKGREALSIVIKENP